MLPRYRNTRAVAVTVPSLTIPMGDGLRFPAIVEGGTLHGVHYYFVDDPEYFDREQLYGVAGKDYPDNAERFAEFCGAAIEFCKHVWMPDVIHCHDWQAGLVPVLLRTRYAKDERAAGIARRFHDSQHGLSRRVSARHDEENRLAGKPCSASTRWSSTGG